MASNPAKLSRKRSIDEIVETSSPDATEHSQKGWKVKTLDEILAEKEKRRKIDQELFAVDEESSRQSRKSSNTSSPALVIDSKPTSQNQTPTQEIIYQLSPDHNSPLSSSSETSRKKSLHLKQKGRRKTDEEEGEILSDISDGESGQNKPRIRGASRHTSVDHDIEMADKTTGQVEASNKEQEESEEESSEEDSDDSSEEDNEQDNKPIEKPSQQKSSEEEEESTDSSEESDESSEEEEEEEEAAEKSKVEVEEKKKTEVKEAKTTEESSEDESEDDSDEDSESEDSEDSDSSEEEEEQQKETFPVNADNKKAKNEVDSGVKKSEKHPSSKVSEVPERPKHKGYSSRDDSSRHQKDDRSRGDERRSRHEQQGKSVDSRERRDRKLKEDSDKVSRKEKAGTTNDNKQSRELKRIDKEKADSSRTRDRSEKQERIDPKSKRKDSKPPEDQTKSNRDRDSKNNSSKTNEKNKETAKNKEKTSSKLLTDEERLQFSTEVVEPDSDNSHESDQADEGSDEEELDVSQSQEEEKEENTAPQLPDYLPAIQGCRNVSEEFVWLNRIEEGTYGVVYRARDKRTNEIVALKRLKMEKEKEGFPITSLREINTLLKGQHPNIVTVREVVVGGNMDKIFIVMDYVEHDLKTLMEHMNSKFSIGEVKTLLVQLLRAVAHLHDNWILHRDLKTSNLLLSNKGILKVADFGLAREYGSPLKHYTPIVVTLWYRAPELLLGAKEYACPIDLWSVGCIFAELLTMKPLFPGKSEIDQINRIFKDLGTPSDKIWPGPPAYSELPHVKKMTFTEYPYNQLRNKFGTHLTDKGFDLLNKFLTYDPKRRVTAEKGLEHDYFNESPFPVKPEMFPTWPAKSEMMKRPKRRDYEHSPKPPEGGEMFSKLKDGGDSSSASGAQGFHMPSSKKGSAAVAGFSLKFNL